MIMIFVVDAVDRERFAEPGRNPHYFKVALRYFWV